MTQKVIGCLMITTDWDFDFYIGDQLCGDLMVMVTDIEQLNNIKYTGPHGGPQTCPAPIRITEGISQILKDPTLAIYNVGGNHTLSWTPQDAMVWL